jgi:hypothetical protein
MKFIETLKNIWKIEDLRSRLLTTILFVLIYRFGSFVVLPGIDPTALTALKDQTSGGLMALLDMFSGGAFANASVFALGIMPYISASIVIQLLTIAVPYFQKMQREGESGRRKMNQYTRYLTVAILLLQGPSYLFNLSVQLAQAGSALPESWWFTISSTIILAGGSMFVMWLGERITDKGIGNGISFIILVGIISRFPGAVIKEFASRVTDAGGGLVMFLLEVVFLLLVIAASIMLVQGTRKIPVQYAKRVVGMNYSLDGSGASLQDAAAGMKKHFGYLTQYYGFYHIFRALYQGSAVFLYQQVAAGGVGVAYAARKGEAVALVAFGYLGGNEGATFGAGFYHEGGVADAGYDAVSLHEVLPVGVGAAHELGEQSALCQHLGGGAAVYSWVDAVQTVSQYAHRVESVGQCLTVGMDVDAVSQPAHYQHVGNQGAEFLHETLAEAFAEAELSFAQKHQIQCLTEDDEAYPSLQKFTVRN